MAKGDIPSSYWASQPGSGQDAPPAHRISKTAWMDLYYDLYMHTHGEDVTTPAVVFADATNRLAVLKASGLRS